MTPVHCFCTRQVTCYEVWDQHLLTQEGSRKSWTQATALAMIYKINLVSTFKRQWSFKAMGSFLTHYRTPGDRKHGGGVSLGVSPIRMSWCSYPLFQTSRWFISLWFQKSSFSLTPTQYTCLDFLLNTAASCWDFQQVQCGGEFDKNSTTDQHACIIIP